MYLCAARKVLIFGNIIFTSVLNFPTSYYNKNYSLWVKKRACTMPTYGFSTRLSTKKYIKFHLLLAKYEKIRYNLQVAFRSGTQVAEEDGLLNR